jgi:hypothetical protein
MHQGMRINRIVLQVSLLAVALLGASCSRNPGAEARPQVRTTLRVENQAFHDMNIYVVHHSQRIRLGTANGASVSVFNIPIRLMGVEQLQFVADPIGGSALPISDSILVTPGEVITLRIPPGSR